MTELGANAAKRGMRRPKGDRAKPVYSLWQMAEMNYQTRSSITFPARGCKGISRFREHTAGIKEAQPGMSPSLFLIVCGEATLGAYRRDYSRTICEKSTSKSGNIPTVIVSPKV